MRANDARKWLHAGLDLLPLILIPVFMIYSHRHTIDSGSIQVQQKIAVDFNQKIDTLLYDENYGDLTYSDNTYTYTYTSDYNGYTYAKNVFNNDAYNWVYGHKYYIKIDTQDNILFRTESGGLFEYASSSVNDILYDCLNNETSYLFFGLYESEVGSTFSFKFLQLFDLTQMFGIGNEPTIQQFNAWYPNDYYSYTLSHKELLVVGTTIYDDTDIMSQFTYQLYNSVDKYFNMGNVFNLGGVYDWFNLNIFAGNAPIALYIVWNIVLYEFVMDLLFLLYGLFMWFIDMMKHIIEKPFRAIK